MSTHDKYLAQLRECCDTALQAVNANDLVGLKQAVQDFYTRIPTYTQSHLGEVLAHAADCGRTECVAYLLSVNADPLWTNSSGLRLAALGGRVECVKLLIPVSDPCANDGQALVCAAAAGNLECVKLLIPVSGGVSNNSRALLNAINNDQMEIIDLLWPVSNPLDILDSDGHRNTKVVEYIQQRMAQEQRERIEQTVAPSCIFAVRKM